MKKQQVKFENHASTREYFAALARFPQFTRLLDYKGKPYKLLLDWLRKNELLLIGQSELPNIGKIAKDLKITSQKLSSYIVMIYDEVFSLNEENPLLFKQTGKTICLLSFHYLGSFNQFSIGLDVIPRKGEAFEFYFVKPKVGCGSFFVESIGYTIENGGQEVLIKLSDEYPLPYFDLMKEKAYILKDLSLEELLLKDYSDFEAKFKLANRYGKL